MKSLLEISDLHVRFGNTHAVRGIDIAVGRGETHCLVGESGCGKSASALSILGLLPRGAEHSARAIRFDDSDLTALPERRMRALRGSRIAMIFQDPMTSLNPSYTVGSQMIEVLHAHLGLGRREAMGRAKEMLARVGVPAPDMRLLQFPHQLSGGLRQRVMIAIALLCEPELLIADEPTTALDVTVQAGILRLLASLQRDFGLSILLITHDLGVVARIADRVSVMYAGEIVESGPVARLFGAPTHPYTRGLLAAIPVPGKTRRGEMLESIPGIVPRITDGFDGCAFRDRCAEAAGQCTQTIGMQSGNDGHFWRCRLPAFWHAT